MNSLIKGYFVVLRNGKRANTLACVVKLTPKTVQVFKILNDGTVTARPAKLSGEYYRLDGGAGWGDDKSLLRAAIATWELAEEIKRLESKYRRKETALKKRNSERLVKQARLQELIEI